MRRSRLAILVAAVFITPSAGAPGAQAQDETAPGAGEFTARVEHIGMISPGTPTQAAGAFRLRGVVERYEFVESSDPRFSGTIEWSGNGDMRQGVTGFDVWQGAFRVENDDGTWEGVPTTWFRPPGADGTVGVTSVLVGTGAYEGWSVVLSITDNGTEFAGMIFEGELPPSPEPYAAE